MGKLSRFHLLATALTLLTILPAHSQSTVGVRGGPTFAYFNGQGAFSFVRPSRNLSLGGYNSSITGYSVGITYNQLFTPFFSLNPELLIMQAGGNFEAANQIGNASSNVKEHIRLNYVQLPLLARANLGGEVLQFWAAGGPYVAYAFGGKRSTSGDYQDDISLNSTGKPYGDFEGSLSRWDFGLAFSAGMAVKAGPGRLGVDLRLQQGLLNLSENRQDIQGTAWNESRFRKANYVFMPSLLYTFRLD